MGLRKTRRLQDQITLLKRTQFNLRGVSNVVRGDKKLNKLPFLEFCQSKKFKFVAIAANHRESNAIVERANHTIREHVSRLALAEPRSSLVDLVAAATFQKGPLEVTEKRLYSS